MDKEQEQYLGTGVHFGDYRTVSGIGIAERVRR